MAEETTGWSWPTWMKFEIPVEALTLDKVDGLDYLQGPRGLLYTIALLAVEMRDTECGIVWKGPAGVSGPQGEGFSL